MVKHDKTFSVWCGVIFPSLHDSFSVYHWKHHQVQCVRYMNRIAHFTTLSGGVIPMGLMQTADHAGS